MWYKLNFVSLIFQTLLRALRKRGTFGILRAMLFPAELLHNDWYNFRLDNIRTLSYNCQVCYLEAALNDRFDPSLRRIVIVDTEYVQQDYIYTLSENTPVYLGTMYLETAFNYSGSNVDFLVKAPANIVDQYYHEIKGLVDFYRLAGKQFNIITL